MAMLKPGDLAPDFQVRAHTGQTVNLSEFEGKNVLLWFYPKADTPGCTIEGKGLTTDHEQFEQKNTVVLGVSFDTVDENRAFAEKFHFPYLLLCDTERRLGMEYGACDSPTATNARRISYLIGPDRKIRKAYDKVQPAEHPTQVLADLGV